MSDLKFEFKGWQAVIVILVIIAVIAVRFLSLSDKKDDKALMKSLEVQLMSEYYPEMAERMKAAVDSGEDNVISEAAESVTTTKLKIDSVMVSYPIFKFSTPKKVVVKVTFSLEDVSGAYQTKTVYYLYKQGGMLNTWQYQYKSGAMSYYLNFL